MFVLIEIAGKQCGRFRLAVPQTCKHQVEAERRFVLSLETSPDTLILIQRYSQARCEGGDLLGRLQSAVVVFFEKGVKSQVQTPFHVQYTIGKAVEGIEFVQGFSYVAEDQCWIARAYSRSQWRRWFYLLHWNGPEQYAESLVLPILDTFDPLDDGE